MIEKNPSPQLSGSRYCEDLLVKNPDNQITWNFFYKSRYYGNRGGPDNRGPPVLHRVTFSSKYLCKYFNVECRWMSQNKG